MTRITDRLLVQRVDSLIVVLDESSGAEVTFPVEVVGRVVTTLQYLAEPQPAVCDRCEQVSVVTVNGHSACLDHLDEALTVVFAGLHYDGLRDL